jgi:transposase InsO family protein
MGLATTGQKYILILKDDFSGFCMLHVCTDADSETTVTALMKWFTLFGVVSMWVSDRGSHFKNRTVAGVKSELRATHHFTTAYCPWANGSVERVCREVLRACRALLFGFRMLTTDWPAVAPLIQSLLNHAPSTRLDGRSPAEVFLNVQADSPLRAIVTDLETSPMSISDIRVSQILHMEDLQKAVEDLHRSVLKSSTARRAAS